MISVIIDNYNYGKYISEAIDSVLNQTYKDYEIIIVDDGSTDNSKDIILDYCNKYPNLITAIFKPNGGQASAFNAGYTLAKGDIICFLDSDDCWYNNKLETVVEFHKKYDFVAHNKKYSNGRFMSRHLKFETQSQKFLKEYGYTSFYDISSSEMSLSHNLLDKIMPMPEDGFKICADLYIILYAAYYANLKYVDKPLLYYRVHGNNGFTGILDNNVKYNRTNRFNTVRKINQNLIKNNLIPIPYINKYLRRLLFETEGNFVIEEKPYVIYGTGESSKSMKEYIEFCDGTIKYYCDSNDKKWGNNIGGVGIISPQDLVTKRNEYYKIVIASMWIDEISDTLNKLGLKIHDDYIYIEMDIVY